MPIDEIEYLRDGIVERDAEIERLRAVLGDLTHWANILSRELDRPELDKAIDKARAALSPEKPTRTVLVFPGDPDLELKE